MARTEPTIKVKGIYKIFGPNPSGVLERVHSGMGKTKLLEQTGHVIGLNNVSLEILPGETFVIMGLSGSGKSTLIRHFNRLIEPTAGSIEIDGQNVMELGDEGLREFRRSKVSMVFQRFALLPHKTVLENVIYGLVIRGVAKAKAEAKGMEQIGLVGLEGFESQYPVQLSGGMQQRVGLARALATDAEIMLMDEAFSALDPLIRNDMQEQLKSLQAKLKKTIVFITHDLDEALRIGDCIAILKDGELRQVATGAGVLFEPADDYVERFVRDVNRARVVTIGSLAAPCPALPLAEASHDACRNALAGHDLLVLYDGSNSGCVVDRGFVGQNGGEFRRRIESLPRSVCVSEGESLENCFGALASNECPLVVVGDDSVPQGIVTRETALGAMVKG